MLKKKKVIRKKIMGFMGKLGIGAVSLNPMKLYNKSTNKSNNLNKNT